MSKKVPEKLRLQVGNAIICSRLLWGAESWSGLTPKQLQLLNGAHSLALRVLAGAKYGGQQWSH
eukprot:12923676-Prorocentrum_lima.AAC.1